MESSDNIGDSAITVSAMAGLKLLLTIPEVAASLSVSRSFVYTLINSGAITTLKIGKSRRVPVMALQEFITQRANSQGI